jgi:hypothetical protein
VTKSRRALSTLILPSDIKEKILADAREFLASEKWYNMAGIPHRRGEYSFSSKVLSAQTFKGYLLCMSLPFVPIVLSSRIQRRGTRDWEELDGALHCSEFLHVVDSLLTFLSGR